MRKYLLFFIAIGLTSAMVFTSCKKESDDSASFPLVGTTWFGESWYDAMANRNYNADVEYVLKMTGEGTGTLLTIDNHTSRAAINMMGPTPVTWSLVGTTVTVLGGPKPLTGEISYYNRNINFKTSDSTYLAFDKRDNENALATKVFRGTFYFTIKNPYVGDYDSELKYFHPTAGGSYPNNPYLNQVTQKKLGAVTTTKVETAFAIWTDPLGITINPDNSVLLNVKFQTYDVKMGDPNDPSKVCRYDPVTGKIYLYYYYSGSGGNRIFWEVFTPTKLGGTATKTDVVFIFLSGKGFRMMTPNLALGFNILSKYELDNNGKLLIHSFAGVTNPAVPLDYTNHGGLYTPANDSITYTTVNIPEPVKFQYSLNWRGVFRLKEVK
jgi:hypothetical protein